MSDRVPIPTDVIPRCARRDWSGPRGWITVLTLASVLAVFESRRRWRARRRTSLMAPTGTYLAPGSTDSRSELGVADFDHLEQQRPAWPEPEDTLPDGIPVDAAEADVLEQAREVSIDDDEREV